MKMRLGVRMDFIPLLVLSEILLIWIEKSHAFESDFHFTQTYQNFSESKRICTDLGYDGLAIVSSPEAYNYAVRVTQSLRDTVSHNVGVYIGLSLDSASGGNVWDDGTVPVSDQPYLSDRHRFTTPDKPFGFITRRNFTAMGNGGHQKFAVCGNYQMMSTRARGSTAHGQQPTGVSSSLSIAPAPAYLECITLCAQDYRCRAAHFNSDLLTCTVLGLGSYTGLVPSAVSQTFIRDGYL